MRTLISIVVGTLLLAIASCETPPVNPECGTVTLPPDTTSTLLTNSNVCFYRGITYQLLAPGFSSQTSTFLWNTGDTVSIIYTSAPGSFSVTITDTNGVAENYWVDLNEFCADVYLPTAFSPNNDGINDQWQPVFTEVCAGYLEIRTVDGARIYESEDPGLGWDGNDGGQAAPGGIYLYHLKLDFNNTSEQNFSGMLDLIR